MDREFCYEALLEAFFHEGVHFVIRLKVRGTPRSSPIMREGKLSFKSKEGKGRLSATCFTREGYLSMWRVSGREGPQEALRIYKELSQLKSELQFPSQPVFSSGTKG